MKIELLVSRSDLEGVDMRDCEEQEVLGRLAQNSQQWLEREFPAASVYVDVSQQPVLAGARLSVVDEDGMDDPDALEAVEHSLAQMWAEGEQF